MANPLAKVIRYIATGGSITASDVQAAIEQIESILLSDHTLLLSHKTRHQNGGADQINVGGLSGLLADQQTPLGHASRHQNGGDDEINVGGLNGVLADEQNAGSLKGVAINVTGLGTNYTLQYNGSQWVVTNTLTGVLPGSHESSHISGGSDQIVGELLSPQKAGKIFSAVINISGLSDKWILKYDSGSGTWIAQTFNHAASHEIGQPDAISSLPTSTQKLALVGTVGTPNTGNEFVTKLDKTSNIDPYLPSSNQKAALDASNSPSASNPFITLSSLNNATASISSGLTLKSTQAFIYDPAVDKKGTPLEIDQIRNTLQACTTGVSPVDRPLALINLYCSRQTSINPGSTIFSNSGTISVTNNTTTLTVASITANDGFGYGDITVSSAIPAILQAGDSFSLTSAANPTNNGVYKIRSIVGLVIKVTVPLPANQGAGGNISSNKFNSGSILVVTGTASNNNKFNILNVVGNLLYVSPAPVNETVTPTFTQYLSDGQTFAAGLMFLNDGFGTPHNFNASPSSIETYQYDNSADHYGILTTEKWIIGDLVSKDYLFVNIRYNPKYGTIPISITNADSPYIPTIVRRNILCDASGGNIVINLPAITDSINGLPFIINARAVGANTITINRNGSDTINGATNIVINTQYASWTLLPVYIPGASYWSIV